MSPKRQYRIEERYRSFNRDYDDRGLIYIRHGEPTDRVSITHPDLPHNQTWKYARPEGDLIFHFVAREDVQDFKLVESVYDILGFDAARQEELCAAYFGEATPALLARMRLQMIMSDVGWTLWAAIQAAISSIDYDFSGWAEERWARASEAFARDDFDDLRAETVAADR